VRRELHENLRQATYDYERQQFNTVVSAAMKMLNALDRLGTQDAGGGAPLAEAIQAGNQRAFVRREGMELLTLLLNPIAPHTAHALWQALGHPETTLEDVAFPKPDPAALQRDSITLAVQVNGKLRGTLDVAVDAAREDIERLAQAEPTVAKFLAGQAVRKVIVVPGKIVNIVAAPA
jgi:leucyl-tRNA synthetase